jgi:hypothetical protein
MTARTRISIDLLTSMQLHVKEHYCQLELEEEEGTFSIICKKHPEPPV